MAAQANFEYKAEVDGEPVVFHLKPVDEIPMGIAMLGEYEDDSAQARDMLKWALSPEEYEQMKLVPMSQALMIIEAWQKGLTGTSLGESVASSISSAATVRQSKQTSSGTGSA